MGKFEKSCGAVLEKDGKVLMVHQNNGVFAFPKGHVEEGETEIETAKREILEETGIRAKLDELKRIEFSYYITEMDINKTVVLFVGRPEGETEPRAQAWEIEEAVWVETGCVEEKLQFPEWKKAWRTMKEML